MTRKNIILLLIALSIATISLILFFNVQKPDESLQRGDRLYSEGYYQQAIDLWSSVAAKNESDRETLYEKIGRAYMKLADMKKAGEYFEKILQVNPDSYPVVLEMISIDLLSGNFTEAERRCLGLKEKFSDDPEVNIVYGDILMLKGKPEDAEIYYKKALMTNTTSSLAALKIATCLVVQSRKEEAGTFFRLALTLSDNSSGINTQLAQYCIISKEYGLAEKYLSEAIAKVPGDLSLKIQLARLYFLQKKPDKARALLEELVATINDNIVLKVLLADMNISEKRMVDAEKLISEIKDSVGSDDPQYNMLQGKFWLFKGNPVYAATHLEAVLDLLPGFIPARYYLSIAYLLSGQKQLAENNLTTTLMYYPDHIDSQLLMADILYKKGSYDLSINYLDKVAAKEPENFRLYMLGGLNHLAKKDFDKAIMLFFKALRLDPEGPSPVYYLGVSYELSDRKNEAIKYYERAMSLKPGSDNLYYRYAMLLINMEKRMKAEGFMASLIEKYPENVYLYDLAAEVYLENSHDGKARVVLEKIINKARCPDYIYIRLAGIYDQQGEHSKAIALLEETVAFYPLSRGSWNLIAKIRLNSGEPDQAIKVLEDALKKLPFDPEILSNLAWLYLDTDKNFDLALEYARSAYEKETDNLAFADTLGWAYYKKGSYVQAIWILKEAVAKDRNNGWLVYHLAMSLYREGSLPEALEYFRKVLEDNVNGSIPPLIKDSIRDHIRKIEESVGKGESVQTHETGSIGEKDLLKFPENNKKDDDILEPQWKDSEGFMRMKVSPDNHRNAVN